MKHVLILACCLSALSVARAQDMAAFFVGIPDEQIPQLEDAWRKDLVELYRAGKPASLENTMNGRSSLLNLTQDYILVQTTAHSTLEMKLLPLINRTYVACVITTVYAPVADSRVAFYTTDWTPLDADALWTPPDSKPFIVPNADADSLRAALASLDVHLFHCRLSADDLTLSVQYVTPEYLPSEEREKVLPVLTGKPKVYRWQAGRFAD
jgi:hypothetical protein